MRTAAETEEGTIIREDNIGDLCNITKMNDYIHFTGNAIFTENFELIKYVNRGSVGIFYEGRFKKNPTKRLGIKFKIRRRREDNQNNNHNQSEVIIQKKLHHPNIICLYGSFMLNDCCTCAFFDFADLGDLFNLQRNRLKIKYMSETALNYIAKQVLDGLEYIHKNKILHMDIKEGNILVDYHLNIKISDFSASYCYSEYDKKNSIRLPIRGTRKYIAPEILKQNLVPIRYIPRIDIYSLGAMLYKMAFNKSPYGLDILSSPENADLAKKIKATALLIPEDFVLSEYFKNFLFGCLNKKIANRLDIKKALNHPWIVAFKTLIEAKEKHSCDIPFITSMMTNSIVEYNKMVNLKKKEK